MKNISTLLSILIYNEVLENMTKNLLVFLKEKFIKLSGKNYSENFFIQSQSKVSQKGLLRSI